jgi:hypothetical protein
MSVFYLDVLLIFLSWSLGDLSGIPGIKSGGNFDNKHCFIYLPHSVVADPHHINADPDLDPSFHFNTDPYPTFTTSMQILIRVLLLINIIRSASTVLKILHGSILCLHASIVSVYGPSWLHF